MPTELFNDANIYRLLSHSRLSPFLREEGDYHSAIIAYQWQMRAQQGLLKPISVTEVTVRNAIDAAIQGWWQEQGFKGDWTDRATECPYPLSVFAHVDGWKSRAAHRMGCRVEDVQHDDIIAHIGLGTWRNMVGNPTAVSNSKPKGMERDVSWEAARQNDIRCAELWKAILVKAFPNIPHSKRERGGMSPRGYIGVSLSRISNLRNRICHWDNMLSVNVSERYADCKQIVEAIDSDLVLWVSSLCDDEIAMISESRPNWI